MGDYGEMHQTDVIIKVLDKAHRKYSEVCNSTLAPIYWLLVFLVATAMVKVPLFIFIFYFPFLCSPFLRLPV